METPPVHDVKTRSRTMAADGGSILHPSLTSVVLPVDDISGRIVSRALQQIENGQDGDPGVVVPAWVRVGDSTPVRDPSHVSAR